MKPVFRTLISLGLGAAIDYFQSEKPLRTWLRKRREAKGKDVLVDPATQDELANAGLERAKRELEKLHK